MNDRQDESFGIIPLRRKDNQWEIFLILHRHGRYWGFPKGHAEDNESHQEAAARELKEETNLDVIRFIREEPLIERYRFMWEKQAVFKTVYYFIAEVSGDIAFQEKEILDGKWVSFHAARDRLTHAEGKSILAQVEKLMATT